MSFWKRKRRRPTYVNFVRPLYTLKSSRKKVFLRLHQSYTMGMVILPTSILDCGNYSKVQLLNAFLISWYVLFLLKGFGFEKLFEIMHIQERLFFILTKSWQWKSYWRKKVFFMGQNLTKNFSILRVTLHKIRQNENKSHLNIHAFELLCFGTFALGWTLFISFYIVIWGTFEP